MCKKFTTEQVISKLKEVHGNKYDYSETVYIDWNTDLLIKCNIHGLFKQRYSVHVNGGNCSKCSALKRGRDLMLTKEQFLEKCKRTHKDTYDYSKVIYKGYHENVEIICKIHGSFFQIPLNHLKGTRCNKCAINSSKIIQTKTTEKFIEQGKKVHNDLYTYENTIYKADKENVIINCRIHGSFNQRPGNHLQGKGCPKCGDIRCSKINKETSSTVSLKMNWLKKAKLYNKTEATFYIIRCWNNEEEFYKYGITYNDLNKRYKGKVQMPYNYEVVKVVKSENFDYIWELEKRFGKFKSKNKYKPLLFFKGCTRECFKN